MCNLDFCKGYMFPRRPIREFCHVSSIVAPSSFKSVVVTSPTRELTIIRDGFVEIDQLCQSLPMPRMGTAAACADVGGIRFRDFERRHQGRHRNSCEPRLNLCEVRVFVEPSRFG